MFTSHRLSEFGKEERNDFHCKYFNYTGVFYRDDVVNPHDPSAFYARVDNKCHPRNAFPFLVFFPGVFLMDCGSCVLCMRWE